MQQAISMVLKQAESTRSKDIRLVRPQNRFSTKPNTLEKTRHVMAPGWELLKKEEKGAWNRNRMGGIGLDWACQWELSLVLPFSQLLAQTAAKFKRGNNMADISCTPKGTTRSDIWGELSLESRV